MGQSDPVILPLESDAVGASEVVEREDLRSIEVSVGGVVVGTDAGAQVSESPKSERGTAKYTLCTCEIRLGRDLDVI